MNIFFLIFVGVALFLLGLIFGSAGKEVAVEEAKKEGFIKGTIQKAFSKISIESEEKCEDCAPTKKIALDDYNRQRINELSQKFAALEQHFGVYVYKNDMYQVRVNGGGVSTPAPMSSMPTGNTSALAKRK